MKKVLFTGVLATLFIPYTFSQIKSKPLISSHNFGSKTELWESVGKGILNFQADVMYIYGKLYITSCMPDSLHHKIPTLTDAYLYPLFNQYKKYRGEIIPGFKGDVFLILNISSQPAQVYKQLAMEMRPYAEMLSFELEGVKHPGKLRVLVKDLSPTGILKPILPGFLGLVGNLSDLDKNIDPLKMPLIEVDFNEITTWKGAGNIPFEDFIKLKELVAKVHAQNKKISIRNCPSSPSLLSLIQTSKADFIITPEAIKMAGFFEAL